MIRGHKPSFYFERGVSADGHTEQGEGRQCVHCQFTWTYRPGSGITRGYCLRHDGFLCGRPECAQLQRSMLRRFAHLHGETDRHCMSYSDYVERLREEFARDPRYVVLPSGIVMIADPNALVRR
jgi:hypothetical protein